MMLIQSLLAQLVLLEWQLVLLVQSLPHVLMVTFSTVQEKLAQHVVIPVV